MKYIFILLFSFNSLALETLILGGGGEPRGDTTIFDDSLRELLAKKVELKLKPNIVFNGNHSKTESIIQEATGSPTKFFSKVNYNNTIKEYIEKIETGKIKSGEQLLVFMNSHGGEKSDGIETHTISMGGEPIKNYDQIDGDKNKSMDVLFDLAKIAKEKNIKLAIVDFSCHSGNSLPLANSNTCVITASGPNNFAYSSFASHFISEMKPGKSLEEIFLNARKKENLPSFPMISTAEGKKVSRELYQELMPYLFYSDSIAGLSVDKLTPYLKSVINNEKLCERERDFNKLLEKFKIFEQLNGKIMSSFNEEIQLVEKLKEYKKLQDNYLKILNDSNYAFLKKKEKIFYGGTKKPSGQIIGQQSEEITWEEILNSYSEGNLNYLKEAYQKETDKEQRKLFKNAFEKLTAIQKKRAEIIKNNPKIKSYEKVFKEVLNSRDRIFELTTQVTELGNIYFDKMYNVHSNNQKTSEPCRDFIL